MVTGTDTLADLKSENPATRVSVTKNTVKKKGVNRLKIASAYTL
jgi:hypothetical protein